MLRRSAPSIVRTFLRLPTTYCKQTQWVWDNRQFRPNSAPPVPKTMKSEAELKNLLTSAKPESLVVVKYHAIMCAASKAIEGKFRHTAAEFGDLDGQEVTFADVCFDCNRQLCEKMGIRSVPHVQVQSLRVVFSRLSRCWRGCSSSPHVGSTVHTVQQG